MADGRGRRRAHRRHRVHRHRPTTPPAETITGIYVDGRVIGQANQPMGTVPHPRTYDAMEGITARHLSADEFEGLWSEARAKFPH
ncbi:hypothetical protein [Corynebacterium coyleae]|uniref:hypothetical protein n=1 Tax=Corynebacterium coyleae TaxID=53374 RepID=UPI003B00BC83